MEELADAIYGLKESMDEIFADNSKLPFISDGPGYQLLEKMDTIDERLNTLTDYIGDLTGIMEEILKVQQKAMKWQEMFG